MPTHTRFGSESEPSGSEDDETEKQLLKKFYSQREAYSDSEEEVFGVGPSDDDDDDDDSKIALSDVEGQDDKDDIPDPRAWGKDKRKYYSTDYIDPDYGGFQGKDAQLAELEEEEARNLQKQLAEQLDDDDFSLDIFTKKVEENKKQTEEVIKTDVSKLSKRQLLQILQRESPEFFGLVEDFRVKMSIAKDYLNPILRKYKKGQISNSAAIDFVQTQYDLILNYCTNIYMYLLLKASKINIQSHPVIKRLYQYRQLLEQLNPVYEEIIKPQLEILIEEEKVAEESKQKYASILNKLTKSKASKKKKISLLSEDGGEKPAKKVKFDDEVAIKEIAAVGEEIDENAAEEKGGNSENEIEKRPINYKIAKNKGLTPHRKKEQRNPRVKHRNKFRKAKIRRKGAIREPRKELSKYGGEISGIKTTVSKSIKIKT